MNLPRAIRITPLCGRIRTRPYRIAAQFSVGRRSGPTIVLKDSIFNFTEGQPIEATMKIGQEPFTAFSAEMMDHDEISRSLAYSRTPSKPTSGRRPAISSNFRCSRASSRGYAPTPLQRHRYHRSFDAGARNEWLGVGAPERAPSLQSSYSIEMSLPV